MSDELNQNHNSAVLKELSDIKASLATNTERTTNMDKSIGEIKFDIRDIKAETISRREFTSYTLTTDKLLETHSNEIESLIGTRNKTIGALIVIQIIWGMIVFLISKFA